MQQPPAEEVPVRRDGGCRGAGGPHDSRVCSENRSIQEVDGEVSFKKTNKKTDSTDGPADFKFPVVFLFQVSVHDRTPDP